LEHERRVAARGFSRIAGVDEAGRGPLAGPVVAAAVILPHDAELPPVKDSKQLTAAEREGLAAALKALPGIAWAVAVVPAGEIDELNILRATHRAMREAVTRLAPPADFALIDGLPVREFPVPSQAIVKGDALSASIAAASILAKTHRDALMEGLEARFPGYGFARHKGYGTTEHLEALRRLGPCPEHRRSFAPVARILEGAPEQLELGL
jgi:ribonuclease HII